MTYGATAVARALGLRRQRLYAPPAAARRVTRSRVGDRELAGQIRTVLDEEPTYGYRRVTARLRRSQRLLNRKRVQRVMRRYGYRSLGYQGRRGHRRQRLPVSKAIHAVQPNRLWGMDHTSFWAGDRLGYVLLATDHCDRDTPGLRISDSPPSAQTAIDVLELARAERRGEYLGELEIRTDGGPQFVAHAFTTAVRKAGLRHTVTPAASPEYNPFAESLLGAFKEECVYQSHWNSYAQAEKEVEAWFKKYRERREQNVLGGLAPLEYRAVLLQNLAA